ncbi:MmgE/PrpD family protein [Cupriavidus pinatubonensis]|uniref:MmgE/PrpD family protein n=1 Tax=Cupriavidus pinatubonensis TaxID=248026 RepID=UPI0037BFACFA
MNGRAGKALEREDKYWVDETIGFAVGCCVVPAAIAAAEARGAVGGPALATAVALAIEMEIRMLRPLGLGFVPGQAVANATFTLGTYGAAVAAAKIFGLGAEGFPRRTRTCALSGLRQFPGAGRTARSCNSSRHCRAPWHYGSPDGFGRPARPHGISDRPLRPLCNALSQLHGCSRGDRPPSGRRFHQHPSRIPQCLPRGTRPRQGDSSRSLRFRRAG